MREPEARGLKHDLGACSNPLLHGFGQGARSPGLGVLNCEMKGLDSTTRRTPSSSKTLWPIKSIRLFLAIRISGTSNNSATHHLLRPYFKKW